jgi:acyl carrier protein
MESAKLPGETELDTETKLIKGGLALDSVALLEFSLALEKEFDCEVSEKELVKENFETIGAVTELFRSKLSEAALAGR